MTTTQTEVESQIMESSAKAFGTFCDEISQMFSVDMSCNQLEPATETVGDLRTRFEKLVAVISVKSEGLLEGTFHFIFDTKGLFTLPGVIIMLPEKRILDKGKYGSAEDAENMSDTMGEAGNLLAGSWDRVFRAEFEGHGHFAQSDTFVGNPRDIPIDKIGLANDEEVLFVPHEMTIGSYPPFNCGVVFPRKIFAGMSASDAETAVSTEEKDGEKTEETAQDQQAATEKAESEESDESRKSDSAEPESQESTAEEASAEGKDQERTEETTQDQQAAVEKAESEVSTEASGEEKAQEAVASAEPTEPTAEETTAKDDTEAAAKEAVEEQEPQGAEQVESEESDESRKSDSVEPESQESTAEEASAEGKPETEKAADDEESTTEVQPEATADAKSDAGQTDVPSDSVEQGETVSADGTRQEQEAQISESIKRMINPPANLAGEFPQAARTIHAKDIMQKKIVWASGDDSVQQAITKIEQGHCGYLIIGTAGAIEGIVSRSDLTGAMSPYLRPMFAKWRRPLDDATLQIKIKWIMSKPARTVNPETALPAIIERICRCDGRCLPVVDEQGNVQGVITVFDILSMLLRAILTISATDRTPESDTSHSH